jgi:hypothetical protein
VQIYGYHQNRQHGNFSFLNHAWLTFETFYSKVTLRSPRESWIPTSTIIPRQMGIRRTPIRVRCNAIALAHACCGPDSSTLAGLGRSCVRACVVAYACVLTCVLVSSGSLAVHLLEGALEKAKDEAEKARLRQVPFLPRPFSPSLFCLSSSRMSLDLQLTRDAC